MAFEELPLPGLTGTVSATVTEPGAAPSNIIQTDHAWQIDVEWEIGGMPAAFLGGEWEVAAYAESIGAGQEKQVGPTQSVPLASAPVLPLPRQYNTTINVPPFSANPVQGLDEGRYRLVVSILYKNGGVPLEMAAFQELPFIMIYEGQP